MKIKKCLMIGGFLCIAVLLYLQIQVLWQQHKYIPAPAQSIIILGHSLEDGVMPGNWLIQRLETGLSLYQKGYAPKILVTGGKGPSDTIPVARSMKQWLINHDVAPEHILVEDEAANTYENFLLSSKILAEHDVDDIIVVTNDFHMYRAMTIASAFFDNPTGQDAPVAFDIRKLLAYMKEPLSLLKYYGVNHPTPKGGGSQNPD